MKFRKDAVQPGKERAAPAVLPDLGDGMEKGTKDKILCVVIIAANTDGGAKQPVTILGDQPFGAPLRIGGDVLPNLHILSKMLSTSKRIEENCMGAKVRLQRSYRERPKIFHFRSAL